MPATHLPSLQTMKLTWTIPVLVVVALCAHEANAQATKKTTTPKPIPCNKAKFKELQTDCCTTPFGIMASDEYLESCICGKKDPEVVEWISYYKMNLLMTADNKTDINSIANNKILCKVAPFINCLFKEYRMQFQGLFYGSEASDAIAKSNPNRQEDYMYMVTDYLKQIDSYYQDGGIPPKWNDTINCVTGTGATKRTKAVYLGNLFLTQYFVTNLYYMCQDPKTDAVCVYKWDRWYNCDGDFQGGAWEGQSARMPQWLSQTIARNLKKMSTYLAKYKQKL